MPALASDLRYAWRLLRRSPGFTLVSILTLALGIGANTALFSVVNAVLLRPLPYSDPDRLAVVWHENRPRGLDEDPLAYETFLDLVRGTREFEALAGLSPRWNMVVSTDEGPEEVPGLFVSASLFPMLGVEPMFGRGFLESEDQKGGTPVAVVSARFWQQRFGRDGDLSGKTIVLNGVSTPIVGVLPPAFRFLVGLATPPAALQARGVPDVDIYMPLGQNPIVGRGRGVRWVTVAGRLAPRSTLDAARAEMSGITAQLAREYPASNADFGARVVPLVEEVVGEVRPAMLMLLGAVGLLLLIACANVANLLLGRATARERELAIRAALGSSRGRLVRQLLTESVVLALAGGAVGIVLAWWAVDLVRAAGPADLPRLEEAGLDPVVLIFTFAISLVTGALFGTAPALTASGHRVSEGLKDGGRTSASGRKGRLRQAFVVTEVALALVLLVGAGLLINSFARLMGVDPGFDPRRVLTLMVGIGGQRFAEDAARRVFFERLFETIGALPGVEAVGGATRLPLGSGVTTRLEIEGRGTPEGERPELEFRRASAGYFDAMSIPLVKGRLFGAEDRPDAPLVALVNQSAVERLWPGEEVIGTRVRIGGSATQPWLTIVGVIGDVKHFGLDKAAAPELYIPFSQAPPTGPLLAIKTTADPAALIPAVRREIRTLEPTAVISSIATMETRVSLSVSQRRFNTWLIGLFAGLALTLAGVGIYGVMSYAVSQRFQEIGIRMALGANPADILRLVVGEGMGLTLAGVSIGLVASLSVTRLLATLLFGIGPTDPLTIASVAAVLVGVAVLACYVPARRATRTDPLRAIRAE
jgi:putative ABC transport system permease protein